LIGCLAIKPSLINGQQLTQNFYQETNRTIVLWSFSLELIGSTNALHLNS
jgi:hypothetical protein